MKRVLAFQIGFACGAGALGCVLLAVVSSAALGQTTGAVSPRPATEEPSAKDEPPPGGCMPIGVTVSGEIVFPFQCKDFIERQKVSKSEARCCAEEQKPPVVEQKADAAEDKTEAKPSAATTAETKPAGAEAKPAAAEEKTAAKQSDDVVPESSKPATEPPVPVPLPKRAERIVGPAGCMHFRTYDAASGTYRTYDGQRRECRAAIGQSARK